MWIIKRLKYKKIKATEVQWLEVPQNFRANLFLLLIKHSQRIQQVQQNPMFSWAPLPSSPHSCVPMQPLSKAMSNSDLIDLFRLLSECKNISKVFY